MAKTPLEIRSLARKHTVAAMKTLAAIMNEPSAPHSARVMAANSILDRGWGKALQTIEATITNADASRVSDKELAAIIAADGREGITEETIDPSQLN